MLNYQRVYRFTVVWIGFDSSIFGVTLNSVKMCSWFYAEQAQDPIFQSPQAHWLPNSMVCERYGRGTIYYPSLFLVMSYPNSCCFCADHGRFHPHWKQLFFYQNVVYGCVAYYSHLSHLTFSDRDSLQWKKWTSPDIPQDIIQHTPTLDHGFLCVQSCRNMELSWVVIIIHFEGIFHYKPSIWGYSHLWEPP